MENLYQYQPGEPVKVNFGFIGLPSKQNVGSFVTKDEQGYLIRFNVGRDDCHDGYYQTEDIAPLYKAGDVVNVFDTGQGIVRGTHSNGAYLVGIFDLKTDISVSFESVLYAAFPVMATMQPELEQLYKYFVVEEAKAGEAKVDYPEGSWPEREAQQYFLGVFAGRVDSLARALHCVGYSPEAVKHIRREATKEHLKTQKEH